MGRLGILEHFSKYLPLTKATPRITLGEGDTPLISSTQIAKELGLKSLHFKFEGANPTGSFKDRGMVVAIAKALEAESRAVICASTGNTSASAAAFAGRFGLLCIVVVPKGKIAPGKLVQAQIAGAKVVEIEGNFDAALNVVRKLGSDYKVTIVNSINPYRLEGQKTAAFEIIEQLGDAPDYLCIPVGNGGNITSYWKGFQEWHAAGLAKNLPKMVGAQAEGAAPLVHGKIIENPETIASAIRIGNPALWTGAIDARVASGGFIDSVTDQEILTAQFELASREGVFCEPASAASLAILKKGVANGEIKKGSQVVAVLTGHGLKDIETASKNLKPTITSSTDVGEIAEKVGLTKK